MDRITSFDADLGRAFVDRGSIGAAVQIASVCFGVDVPPTATALELLRRLCEPDVHSMIEWRQDRLLLTPRVMAPGVTVVARENQACWQAAMRSNDSVEIGNVSSAGWSTWDSMPLGDFLLRLLAVEAVVGHGPCVTSNAVPSRILRPFELLAPVGFEDQAELMGVVAAKSWFGVYVGSDGGTSLYASPAEHVQRDLGAVSPAASWTTL